MTCWCTRLATGRHPRTAYTSNTQSDNRLSASFRHGDRLNSPLHLRVSRVWRRVIPQLHRRRPSVRKGGGMREYLKFYIDGQWVEPVQLESLDVDNPTTEQVSGKIALGSSADVDKAAKAARRAFATWSQTSREDRLDVLQAILGEYQKRLGDP